MPDEGPIPSRIIRTPEELHRDANEPAGEALGATASKSLAATWTEKDDPGADQADGCAEQVPSIGPRAFYDPEPQERGGDVDAP